MRVHALLLSKYTRKAASFRYRLEQYLPYLSERGIQCTVSSLFNEEYLTTKYMTGRVGITYAAGALLRRTATIASARRYDVAVIFGEAYPAIPAVLERSLSLMKVPYIMDFDDAIFHNYDRSPNPIKRLLIPDKIRNAIRGSSAVFAGNEYLAEYSRSAGVPRVVEMPTVLPLERYNRTKRFGSDFRPFTVGWIGSPTTAGYLQTIVPVLRKFFASHPGRLVVVGAGHHVDLNGVPSELREWSETRELDDLLDFDVGIMPLVDDPWCRGKCGFKLIQYMACGLPVIASPVGVNSEIVAHEKNGLLCATPADWEAAFNTLWDNPSLFERYGNEGRRLVENRYSLAVTGPRFASVVSEVACAE
jgi:glycosyltransferase involved in cell wall biosynthesis